MEDFWNEMSQKGIPEEQINTLKEATEKAALFDAIKEERDTLLKSVSHLYNSILIHIINPTEKAPSSIVKAIPILKGIFKLKDLDRAEAEKMLSMIWTLKEKLDAKRVNALKDSIKPSISILKKYKIINDEQG